MKLRIGDTEYDYLLAIRKIPIRELMRLQSQGGPNRRQIQLGWDTLDRALLAQGRASTPEEQAAAAKASDDVMDSPEVLIGMAGTVFLAKAFAGEPITWDEAQGYAWPDDVNFVVEPSDLPDEPPDPPEASGAASQPDAETKSGKPSRPRTGAAGTRKTSKPRSSATSS